MADLVMNIVQPNPKKNREVFQRLYVHANLKNKISRQTTLTNHSMISSSNHRKYINLQSGSFLNPGEIGSSYTFLEQTKKRIKQHPRNSRNVFRNPKISWSNLENMTLKQMKGKMNFQFDPNQLIGGVDERNDEDLYYTEQIEDPYKIKQLKRERIAAEKRYSTRIDYGEYGKLPKYTLKKKLLQENRLQYPINKNKKKRYFVNNK